GIAPRGTFAPTLRHQEPANSDFSAQNELASLFELFYDCFRLWYPTGCMSNGSMSDNLPP
ncbi:hypothetical protein JMJ77_0006770, partial [Colletotrichum scovillei]